MSEVKRSSRADRRRNRDAFVGMDRRGSRPSPPKILSQKVGEELHIHLQSVITADNTVTVRESLLTHSARYQTMVVGLDLEKVPYMDTTGLSLIFEFKRMLAEKDRQLVLMNPSRIVQRMLNITRMSRVFPIRTTSPNLERIPTAGPVSPPHSRTANAEPKPPAPEGFDELDL